MSSLEIRTPRSCLTVEQLDDDNDVVILSVVDGLDFAPHLRSESGIELTLSEMKTLKEFLIQKGY
jgi:hypothetical protein